SRHMYVYHARSPRLAFVWVSFTSLSIGLKPAIYRFALYSPAYLDAKIARQSIVPFAVPRTVAATTITTTASRMHIADVI
ncbi:hypothetical protein GGX14DRAFT_410469, partial [Mycena pura]